MSDGTRSVGGSAGGLRAFGAGRGLRGVRRGGVRGLLVGVLAVLAVVLGLMVTGLVTVARRPGAGAAKGPVTVRRDDAAQRALDSARNLVTQGEYGQALALLEGVLPLFKNDQDLRLVQAQALIGAKRFAEAYEAMRTAIDIGPALPQLHFDAGTVANSAGLLDKAEYHYSLAQKEDPGNAAYPLYLAMIQIKKEQPAQATASLLRVIKLDESIAEAWGTLAELQLKEGRPGVAGPQFGKAMKLQPSVARWRIGAARAALAENDRERAEAILAGLTEAQRKEPAAQAVMAELRP